MSATRSFSTEVTVDRDGRCIVPVPFDPDVVWGPKARHHVNGTIDGKSMRAVIEEADGGPRFVLGPMWVRDCQIDGGQVTVVMSPEGPQRADLADDVARALDADPEAGAFFDSLAQFYRKAYLTWINATKRSPEKRAERIAEMISLLKNGKKERPKA